MQPIAVFCLKLSKQLAFVTCLLILSRASGRADLDPIWILAVASLSSLLHLASRAVRMRASRRICGGSNAA